MPGLLCSAAALPRTPSPSPRTPSPSPRSTLRSTPRLCSHCQTDARKVAPRCVLPADPATRCLIDWDPVENRLVNAALCEWADREGNRIVHFADFQASTVISEWSSTSSPPPEKRTIIRALIEHSDLGAVNFRGQNPLHTHAQHAVRTASVSFFEVLHDYPPENLADLLKARDHHGDTVLNTASSWTGDEDCYMNFDLGLVQLLSGPFTHIAPDIDDVLRRTALVPNDFGLTPLNHYMCMIASACDIDARYLDWLADAGADLLTIDNCGRTLLHICAETSTESVGLSTLAARAISAGVHPAQSDSFGQTALHSAASNNECSQELIHLLVMHCTGTNPHTLKNCDNRSPLDIARACGYQRVERLIASARSSRER